MTWKMNKSEDNIKDDLKNYDGRKYGDKVQMKMT